MNKPTDADQSWQEWRKPPTRVQFSYKLVICALLYAGTWLAFHSNHPYAELAENQVRRALTVSYDFAEASAWYTEHIGQWRSFLPAFLHTGSEPGPAKYDKPAAGTMIRSYSTAARGIWMTTGPEREVTPIATGLVLSAAQSTDGTWTVVMRHADQVESVYGGLEQAAVDKNDWLTVKDKIGTAKLDADRGVGLLYLAIRRNHMYMDPGEVIPLD